MRFKPGLIPRLNYDYSIKDVFSSLYSLNNNLSQERLESIFENKNIFFLNHARTGLRILLSSLNLKPNAKVGVQAYNCHTVFQAIKKAGFSLVFIDVNHDFTIDLKDLKKKIDRIDALIVTHTFGMPAKFDQIKKISRKIPIIEDCAHSFLSYYKEKLTGTLGDASIFSFGQAKFPSIGSGGFVIINKPELCENFSSHYSKLPKNSLFKEIKNIFLNYFFALAHKKLIYGLFTFPIGKWLDKKMDFANKFKFFESKALKSNKNLFLKKFDKYKKYSKKQIKNAHKIIQSCENQVTSKKNDCNNIINYFMVPVLKKDRNTIIEYSIKHGIEFGKHFSNSIIWAKSFGYQEGNCPNIEMIINKIITIPCHYNMAEKNLKKIYKLIEEINENIN